MDFVVEFDILLKEKVVGIRCWDTVKLKGTMIKTEEI